jgi:GGDEF domain-containing protein
MREFRIRNGAGQWRPVRGQLRNRPANPVVRGVVGLLFVDLDGFKQINEV